LKKDNSIVSNVFDHLFVIVLGTESDNKDAGDAAADALNAPNGDAADGYGDDVNMCALENPDEDAAGMDDADPHDAAGAPNGSTDDDPNDENAAGAPNGSTDDDPNDENAAGAGHAPDALNAGDAPNDENAAGAPNGSTDDDPNDENAAGAGHAPDALNAGDAPNAVDGPGAANVPNVVTADVGNTRNDWDAVDNAGTKDFPNTDGTNVPNDPNDPNAGSPPYLLAFAKSVATILFTVVEAGIVNSGNKFIFGNSS